MSHSEIELIKFKPGSIVFFDLCGTLYDANTTMDFLDYYFRSDKLYLNIRFLTKLKLVKAINFLSIKILKYDFIRTWAIGCLSGISVVDIDKSMVPYFETLESKKIEVSHLLLLKAKANQCKLVMLSASLDSIVSYVSDQLGISEYAASSLQRNDGKMVGKLAVDLLGQKQTELCNRIKDHQTSYFITDNVSDANCIDLVTKFIAISPKKSLTYWNKKKNIAAIYEV